MKILKSLKNDVKKLNPAIFGDYGLDHVTIGSINIPKVPVVLGLGLQSAPGPPPLAGMGSNGPMKLNPINMTPGVTLRIGGNPDVTDKTFKSIVNKFRLR